MKKLAIIGASYLQLPLVNKAKKMGIETHVFAWEDGAVCKNYSDYFYPISILEKDKILKYCKKISIDGITSIGSDAAVPTICFVADEMGLKGNSYLDALICTNKYLMRKRFFEFNIPSPKFLLDTEIVSFENFKFPLIVKPTDRSGSRGVKKIMKPVEALYAIDRAKNESFSKQAIIEEFITGKEVSVESITIEGEHFILAFTDKVTTGEPYFVELEHHQPSNMKISILDKIKMITVNALNALNIKNGASHAEFIVTANGDVYVVEIGARMGGDFIGSNLVQLSTGYDYLKGVINVALNVKDIPVIRNNYCAGVYFLCTESIRVLDFIKDQSKYKEIIEAKILNNDIINVESSTDRNGYLIYRGESRFII